MSDLLYRACVAMLWLSPIAIAVIVLFMLAAAVGGPFQFFASPSAKVPRINNSWVNDRT
jgi:hypothetical protein